MLNLSFQDMLGEEYRKI